MSAELLPCPHCGGRATTWGQAAGLDGDYFCRCDNPDCYASVGTYGLSGDEAIDAWNRRTESAEIAALRSELEQVRTVADEAELNRELVRVAHAELRELRGRIANAPNSKAEYSDDEMRLTFPDMADGALIEMDDKRFAFIELRDSE